MTDKPERKMKKKIFDKWFWPQSVSGVKFILSGKPPVPLSSAVQWCIAWCDQILLPWFPSQTFSYIGWLMVAVLQMHQLWADLSSSLPVIASSAVSPLVLTVMKETGICSKILSCFSFQSHCLQPFLSFGKGWVCSAPAPSEMRWWMHLHSILLPTRTVLAKWITRSFPLTVLFHNSEQSQITWTQLLST